MAICSKLGFEVAQSTVAKYMVKRWGPPSQGWRTFLRNRAPDIAAMDLLVVPTVGFSLRRECLDHILLTGEQYLRRVLKCYMEYYNAVRTHLSLGKDAPNRRAVRRHWHIKMRPILGGLHHQYVWI
jgi:hypothetical protein